MTKSLIGKVNFYDPALTRNEFKQYETRKFLGRLYGGSVKNFIASLVDNAELSQSDIAELREWFARKQEDT